MKLSEGATTILDEIKNIWPDIYEEVDKIFAIDPATQELTGELTTYGKSLACYSGCREHGLLKQYKISQASRLLMPELYDKFGKYLVTVCNQTGGVAYIDTYHNHLSECDLLVFICGGVYDKASTLMPEETLIAKMVQDYKGKVNYDK